MEDKTIAVYFGGFRQDRIEGTSNAFSEWIKTLKLKTTDSCFINLWSGEQHDSMDSRWKRAARRLNNCRNGKKIHILAYSIGCHLAVRFAHELLSTTTEMSFGDFWLIAPDPKFVRTELDELDETVKGVPSAYAETNNFWDRYGCPGENFAFKLGTLPSKLGCKVRIVYSEKDSVSEWPDNVKRLWECNNGRAFEWFEANNDSATNGTPRCSCKLEPRNAQGEYWVHEQLFMETKMDGASTGSSLRSWNLYLGGAS